MRGLRKRYSLLALAGTGVRKVDVDVENKTVDVEYDSDEGSRRAADRGAATDGIPARRG